MTISSLSMQCSECCAQARRGTICPPDYGDWKTTHQRFCRWRDLGVWEFVLERLLDEPDDEWLMIDASHCKVHPHAAGARGGNQGLSGTKKGAQHETAFGRGCAWYAGPNHC